jgi:OOP family OmpA-OmpF porin
MKRGFAHALVLLFAAVGPAAAEPPTPGEQPRREAEVGIQGGFFWPDRDLSGKDDRLREVEPVAGLRGGYLFADHWGWFADVTASDTNTNTPAGDVDTRVARTGAEWFSRDHWTKLHWFVALGAGLVEYDLEDGDSVDRTLGSLSVGQRLALDRRARFRWELRVDQTLADEGFAGEDLTQPQLLLGLTWGLGRRHGDADADGVYDRGDACPDTPRGARVDGRGCPLDSDRDGVHDGIDECPNTPHGATVDARGCPRDGDGDGVYDGIDQCPDTPHGATVDARGCPLDGDGDGVYDGIDQCPDTPHGVVVDGRGCPLDSDADGVTDGLDRCPGTPRGTPVNPDGCPKAAPLFTPERESSLVLEGVYFEYDSAVLAAESRSVLDRVAASLIDWPEVRVQVEGHTDSKGREAYNLALSRRRAEAVRTHLIERGVAAGRVSVEGYGESRPVDDNGTESGRARNRRVELRRM